MHAGEPKLIHIHSVKKESESISQNPESCKLYTLFENLLKITWKILYRYGIIRRMKFSSPFWIATLSLNIFNCNWVKVVSGFMRRRDHSPTNNLGDLLSNQKQQKKWIKTFLVNLSRLFLFYFLWSESIGSCEWIFFSRPSESNVKCWLEKLRYTIRGLEVSTMTMKLSQNYSNSTVSSCHFFYIFGFCWIQFSIKFLRAKHKTFSSFNFQKVRREIFRIMQISEIMSPLYNFILPNRVKMCDCILFFNLGFFWGDTKINFTNKSSESKLIFIACVYFLKMGNKKRNPLISIG